jgi:CHAD domain-containing protein
VRRHDDGTSNDAARCGRLDGVAERKFTVDDSTVSPSFDGIVAVASVKHSPMRSWETVYLDTASHDLAARKISLGARTGGPDPQWQLTLPAGPDARTKVCVPLQTDTVPDGLVDVVLAIVRDRELTRIAHISTARHHRLLYDAAGGLLAEFFDDLVAAETSGATAERQRWREWRLTATDGQVLDQLGHRLLDAGATSSEHGCTLGRILSRPGSARPGPADPLHRTLGEYLDELLIWDRGVRADADDAVHQMRVTTRKIRSLLQAAPGVFGLTGSERVLEELRELAAVLGAARDAEVLAQRYRAALAELAPELVRGRVSERLIGGACSRYRSGLRRSLAAMRSSRYFRLLDDLDALASGEPSDEPDVPATVGAAYRRLRKATKAAKTATGTDHDDALHRIRKSAKRLRYTATATGVTKVASRAKTVQALLGEHQDAVVSRTHLLRCADAALAAGEDTFSYGVLCQRENDLARHHRGQLDDALGRLDKAARRIR